MFVDLHSYLLQHALEDAMDLIAKLPPLASAIYCNLYRDGKMGTLEADKDWSANFATMLGYDNPEFTELMRLYLTIHSDHEGAMLAHTRAILLAVLCQTLTCHSLPQCVVLLAPCTAWQTKRYLCGLSRAWKH